MNTSKSHIPEPAVNSQSTRSKNTRLIVIGVLTALAVGMGSVWWWMNRDVDPIVLNVGAGPYRSDSYDLMKEVAEVLERHSDMVRLNVTATLDSSQNISLLNKGEIDLATIRSDTPVVSDVRLIGKLFPDYFQIFARKNSRIFSVGDLIGKRIAIPSFGRDDFRSFWIIADHYDLPIGAIKWKPMPFEDATQALLAGDVDALFTVRSLRDRLLLNLFEDASLKKLRLNFIEIDQASAIALKRPFINVGKVPKGAFIGSNPTPTRTMITAIVNRVLVTREDVDDGAIAELTRVLFEQRLDLVIRFALASAVTRPDTEHGLSAPLHAGSRRYFDRDQPSFLQENAEPIALVVTIFAMMISGLLALRRRLINSQKNQMDSYNYMLLDIGEKARACLELDKLDAMKMQLFEIQETVVKALDTDDITDEGYQSFSHLWESVRDVLRERVEVLKSAD